ncbi:sporulation protein YqfD [Halanaerocella petrolearia]
MFQKLYDFCRGYVQLKVSGRRYTKLINDWMRQGIELWNIIRIDDTIYVNINVKDFKKVRKSVRNTDCKVEIYQKRGLPFWINKLIRRRVLAIGILFIILAVYTLSHFVLFIEIKGVENLDKSEINSILKKVKIRPGVLKSKIPTDKLSELIVESKRQVSWANVYFQGTKLIVEVVEKELIDTTIEPADIVAHKPGIISEIIVLKGSPQVKEGMTVSTGDTLISSKVKVKKQVSETTKNETEEEDKGVKIDTKEVKAEGIVKAKVWYEGYGEAKLTRYYQQPTDNIKTSLAVRINKQEFILTGPKKPPYSNFRVEKEVKSLPQWRNHQLPIEIVIRKYIQIKEFKEQRSLVEAKQVAKEKAIDRILQGVEKKAIILNSKLKLIKVDNEDKLIRVKALVEVEEEIGTRREEILGTDN